MYSPCLVLPYHSSPSLWNTFVEVLTQTLPPPPPGAAVIVEGSTGAALAVFAFFSVFAGASVFAGPACARQRLEVTANNSARTSNLAFVFFILFSFWHLEHRKRHATRNR